MKRWGEDQRDALRVLADTDADGDAGNFVRGALYAFTSCAFLYGVIFLLGVAVSR